MDILSIQSTLDHDGDEIVRFRISAKNVEFEATVMVWGNESDAKELASLLSGFPKSMPAQVEYSFGSPRTGQCALNFETVDRTGRCCVWGNFEAAYKSGGSERFQRAEICIEFVPGSLDNFVAQLSRFKRGVKNEAILKAL
jgi:hypothetical protein